MLNGTHRRGLISNVHGHYFSSIMQRGWHRDYALTIHFDGLIQSGAVANYSALARLANVTRARMTQIMNLLMLAPEIQEQILFLPRAERERDELCLRELQPVAGVVVWEGQQQAALPAMRNVC